jgi:hypothetical protein
VKGSNWERNEYDNWIPKFDVDMRRDTRAYFDKYLCIPRGVIHRPRRMKLSQSDAVASEGRVLCRFYYMLAVARRQIDWGG